MLCGCALHLSASPFPPPPPPTGNDSGLERQSPRSVDAPTRRKAEHGPILGGERQPLMRRNRRGERVEAADDGDVHGSGLLSLSSTGTTKCGVDPSRLLPCRMPPGCSGLFGPCRVTQRARYSGSARHELFHAMSCHGLGLTGQASGRHGKARPNSRTTQHSFLL